MEVYVYMAAFALLILFFAYQSAMYKKRNREKLEKKIKNSWGNIPDREYSSTEYERIRKYYDAIGAEKNVDDITWNDMGMDNIFISINNTLSSIGEENLYNRLRTMDYSDEELKEFDRVVSFFENNPDKAMELQKYFAGIGRTKSISVYEFIHNLTGLGERRNTKHYLMAFGLLATIGWIFVSPPYGIVAMIIMVCINVIRYYRIKAEVENYFVCCNYLVGVLLHGKSIASVKNDELVKYNNEIMEICDKMSAVTKRTFLISGDNMSGSISEMLMEYIRILFHVDLIKFNDILKKTITHLDDVDRLYEVIGYLESACAVASYRVYLKKEYGYYCKPEFVGDKQIFATDIYHPSIKNPVTNSINEKKGILLTGSNASGKSTFLKTIGINAILSQTIYTCSGKEFSIKRSRVYSSMSLRDDLMNNESYYIVEIKALKRIIDAAKEGEEIICFVDEVLRGTNTVERVSASTEILKSFSDGKIENVICFAATHDIELTHLLEKWYANYHFEERIENDDVIFNYKLNKGRATSRNAIQLLKVIGYDDDIINAARLRADNFTKTGKY